MHSFIHRRDLLQSFDRLLEPERFEDYGPNGLQVEGKAEIRKIVSGVTASQALIEGAIVVRADAIFVHHGLFWRGQRNTVTGWLKQRLKLLLAHEINLYAYHLPLDAHPQWGNNAQLALQLGWQTESCTGPQKLIHVGRRRDGAHYGDAAQLQAHLQGILARPVLHVGPEQTPIECLAWCTGGAQSYFEAAIDAGAQAFITGEISEPQAHLARECEVSFFACGHHATERYGAAALGAHLCRKLGLEHEFIDIDNPA